MKIDGPYVPHIRQLIEAPAWRTLSLSARRVLDRVELEHLRHGGKENGQLAVTFEQFVASGIHRHAIAPAIREARALGFLEITRPGTAGNAEFRTPNWFRLTYLPSMGTNPATHEWRSMATIDHAEMTAREARKSPQQPRQQPSKPPACSGQKTKSR